MPKAGPPWPYILKQSMSERIIALLVHFVTHVIDMGGYAGIVALMGIESACIPLPSEIIMPFAGYLVYLGHFSLFWAATAGAWGCNLGSQTADRKSRRPSSSHLVILSRDHRDLLSFPTRRSSDLPFARYQVSMGHFSLFWAATAGAVGCNLGSQT